MDAHGGVASPALRAAIAAAAPGGRLRVHILLSSRLAAREHDELLAAIRRAANRVTELAAFHMIVIEAAAADLSSILALPGIESADLDRQAPVPELLD
jgi:hypothetical protein